MMKKRFYIPLFILLPIILALVLAEIYVRMTGAYIVRAPQGDGLTVYTADGKRLVPGATATIMSHGKMIPISINSYGFRGPSLPLKKEKNEFRIMVVGDSITFGTDFLLKNTYTGQMEIRLKKAFPKQTVHVINASMEGQGIENEIKVLEEDGIPLNPDIVILQFYLNDSLGLDMFGSVLANPGMLRRHSMLAEALYRRYMLRLWIENKIKEEPEYAWLFAPRPDDILTNRQSFLDYANKAQSDWGAAWQDNSWGVVDRQLQKLADLASRNHFKVVIMCTPVIFQVYSTFLENSPQKKLKALAAKYGFYFYDLLPAFRKIDRNKDRYLFMDQCHYSPNGHYEVGRLMANYITDILKERLDNPPSSTTSNN